MYTYSEVKKEYLAVAAIPYAILLSTTEWQERRGKIISRDKELCQICGKGATDWLGGPAWLIPKKEIPVGASILSITAYYDLVPAEKPYALHVHHKHYIKGNLPWEYGDEALLTLCNWCHWELHQREKIPVYEKLNQGIIIKNLTPCSRCNGVGWFPEYLHVEKGICFRCRGKMFDEFLFSEDSLFSS